MGKKKDPLLEFLNPNQKQLQLSPRFSRPPRKCSNVLCGLSIFAMLAACVTGILTVAETDSAKKLLFGLITAALAIVTCFSAYKSCDLGGQEQELLVQWQREKFQSMYAKLLEARLIQPGNWVEDKDNRTELQKIWDKQTQVDPLVVLWDERSRTGSLTRRRSQSFDSADLESARTAMSPRL